MARHVFGLYINWPLKSPDRGKDPRPHTLRGRLAQSILEAAKSGMLVAQLFGGEKMRALFIGLALAAIILSGSGAVMAEPQDKSAKTTSKKGTSNPKIEGVVIQGNKIKALPGYTLQPGPNNQMIVRRAGGGPLGHTFPGCGCKGGSGSCTISTDSGGTGGSCYKRSTDTCNGQCGFNANVIGGGVLRPQ
jgi:hypothetical protein